MFNSNCYGNESIPTYTQGVESPWSAHTTHNSQGIFHQHPVAGNANAFVGYGLGQVQSKEMDLAGMVGMKESSGASSTPAATNAWHHGRMRYSGTAASARGFLPYQMSSLHYENQSVDPSHLSHGTHQQPFWVTNPNAYSLVGYQRDHNTYGERADTSRSTAALRHNTAMPNRNYAAENESRNVNATLQQQPAQVISQHCQRQSRQSMHQLQQQQQLHHQQNYLRNQMSQRERDPCQYTSGSYHQEGMRVGVDPSLYHDQHLTQQHHQQYSQEAMRKASETDRRTAFATRQTWPQTWPKPTYVPFDTPQTFLSNHRSAGSAFTPCTKQTDSDPYSMDSIWAKSSVPTAPSHVATNHAIPATNNHMPLTAQPWLHDTTYLKPNVYRTPQDMNQVTTNVPSNFSTNVLNLDTGQVEQSMSAVPHELSLYPQAVSQSQGHRSSHPASVPVQPSLPAPPVPQNHAKPAVKEPPKPVEPSKPTSTARAAGLDVRQFLATWDEDLDLATPRPAVVETDEPEPDPPPSLVVLDYQNVPSEQAAGLLQLYPGLQLSGNDPVVLLDNPANGKTNLDFVLSQAVPTSSAPTTSIQVSQPSAINVAQSPTTPAVPEKPHTVDNNQVASPCDAKTSYVGECVDQPRSQEPTTPASLCESDSEKGKKSSLRLFRKRKLASAESDASSQCSESVDEVPAKSLKSDECNSLSNWFGNDSMDTIDGPMRTPVSVSSAVCDSPADCKEYEAKSVEVPEPSTVSVITMNHQVTAGRSMPDISDYGLFEAGANPEDAKQNPGESEKEAIDWQACEKPESADQSPTVSPESPVNPADVAAQERCAPEKDCDVRDEDTSQFGNSPDNQDRGKLDHESHGHGEREQSEKLVEKSDSKQNEEFRDAAYREFYDLINREFHNLSDQETQDSTDQESEDLSDPAPRDRSHQERRESSDDSRLVTGEELPGESDQERCEASDREPPKVVEEDLPVIADQNLENDAPHKNAYREPPKVAEEDLPVIADQNFENDANEPYRIADWEHHNIFDEDCRDSSVEEIRGRIPHDTTGPEFRDSVEQEPRDGSDQEPNTISGCEHLDISRCDVEPLKSPSSVVDEEPHDLTAPFALCHQQANHITSSEPMQTIRRLSYLTQQDLTNSSYAEEAMDLSQDRRHPSDEHKLDTKEAVVHDSVPKQDDQPIPDLKSPEPQDISAPVSPKTALRESKETTKYLSRIVGSAPGKIPKILLSRLKDVRENRRKNGVVKKLPSIRLRRVRSSTPVSGDELPEYECKEQDYRERDVAANDSQGGNAFQKDSRGGDLSVTSTEARDLFVASSQVDDLPEKDSPDKGYSATDVQVGDLSGICSQGRDLNMEISRSGDCSENYNSGAASTMSQVGELSAEHNHGGDFAKEISQVGDGSANHNQGVDLTMETSQSGDVSREISQGVDSPATDKHDGYISSEDELASPAEVIPREDVFTRDESLSAKDNQEDSVAEVGPVEDVAMEISPSKPLLMEDDQGENSSAKDGQIGDIAKDSSRMDLPVEAGSNGDFSAEDNQDEDLSSKVTLEEDFAKNNQDEGFLSKVTLEEDYAKNNQGEDLLSKVTLEEDYAKNNQDEGLLSKVTLEEDYAKNNQDEGLLSKVTLEEDYAKNNQDEDYPPMPILVENLSAKYNQDTSLPALDCQSEDVLAKESPRTNLSGEVGQGGHSPAKDNQEDASAIGNLDEDSPAKDNQKEDFSASNSPNASFFAMDCQSGEDKNNDTPKTDTPLGLSFEVGSRRNAKTRSRNASPAFEKSEDYSPKASPQRETAKETEDDPISPQDGDPGTLSSVEDISEPSEPSQYEEGEIVEDESRPATPVSPFEQKMSSGLFFRNMSPDPSGKSEFTRRDKPSPFLNAAPQRQASLKYVFKLRSPPERTGSNDDSDWEDDTVKGAQFAKKNEKSGWTDEDSCDSLQSIKQPQKTSEENKIGWDESTNDSVASAQRKTNETRSKRDNWSSSRSRKSSRSSSFRSSRTSSSSEDDGSSDSSDRSSVSSSASSRSSSSESSSSESGSSSDESSSDGSSSSDDHTEERSIAPSKGAVKITVKDDIQGEVLGPARVDKETPLDDSSSTNNDDRVRGPDLKKSASDDVDLTPACELASLNNVDSSVFETKPMPEETRNDKVEVACNTVDTPSSRGLLSPDADNDSTLVDTPGSSGLPTSEPENVNSAVDTPNSSVIPSPEPEHGSTIADTPGLRSVALSEPEAVNSVVDIPRLGSIPLLQNGDVEMASESEKDEITASELVPKNVSSDDKMVPECDSSRKINAQNLVGEAFPENLKEMANTVNIPGLDLKNGSFVASREFGSFSVQSVDDAQGLDSGLCKTTKDDVEMPPKCEPSSVNNVDAQESVETSLENTANGVVEMAPNYLDGESVCEESTNVDVETAPVSGSSDVIDDGDVVMTSEIESTSVDNVDARESGETSLGNTANGVVEMAPNYLDGESGCEETTNVDVETAPVSGSSDVLENGDVEMPPEFESSSVNNVVEDHPSIAESCLGVEIHRESHVDAQGLDGEPVLEKTENSLGTAISISPVIDHETAVVPPSTELREKLGPETCLGVPDNTSAHTKKTEFPDHVQLLEGTEVVVEENNLLVFTDAGTGDVLVEGEDGCLQVESSGEFLVVDEEHYSYFCNGASDMETFAMENIEEVPMSEEAQPDHGDFYCDELTSAPVEEVVSCDIGREEVCESARVEEPVEDVPLQVKCSLSWDRILNEGQGLVLGPANREPGEEHKNSHWKVVTRERQRASRSKRFEENNNLMPDVKSPIVMVKSLLLKRPRARKSQRKQPHVWDVEPKVPLKTKAALKAFQAQTDLVQRSRHRSWPSASDTGWKPSMKRRKSEVGPSTPNWSCASPQRLPKVIIKRTGEGPQYQSFICEKDVIMQPVVSIERNTELDNLAMNMWSDMVSPASSPEATPPHTETKENSDSNKTVNRTRKRGRTGQLMKVVELLQQWRQDEATKNATIENNNSLLCFDNNDEKYLFQFHSSESSCSSDRRNSRASSVTNDNSYERTQGSQDKTAEDIAQEDSAVQEEENIVEEGGVQRLVESPLQESIVENTIPPEASVHGDSDIEVLETSTLREADSVQDSPVQEDKSARKDAVSALHEDIVVQEADSVLQEDVYQEEIRKDLVSCTESGNVAESTVEESPLQSRRTSIEEELGLPLICQVCGFTTTRLEEQANHIKTHSYHCQRCQLAFTSHDDFKEHLAAEHPTIEELHHCLLCQRSFPTAERHAQHKKGWHHSAMERSQRHTIHTMFQIFTGSECPFLPSLAPEEAQTFDWPSDPGVIHFYHDATPLQLAVQDCQGAKDDTETC